MKTEETVTWKEAGEISAELLSRLAPLDEQMLATLDGQNGIYIVAYSGNELGDHPWDTPQQRIVYVGRSKANSSRHFISGNTGSSTLRRSLAALLLGRLDLHPIPQPATTAEIDRYSNYQLDRSSEEKLTEWMRANFRVAFLTLPADKIEPTELALIDYNAPIFNFQHNPGNTYGSQIKIYRKQCAELAAQNEGQYE